METNKKGSGLFIIIEAPTSRARNLTTALSLNKLRSRKNGTDNRSFERGGDSYTISEDEKPSKNVDLTGVTLHQVRVLFGNHTK